MKDEQIPMQLLETMQIYIRDPITFLIVLNIFLLLVGCMMDIFSAIIVVVPLIVPIAKRSAQTLAGPTAPHNETGSRHRDLRNCSGIQS